VRATWSALLRARVHETPRFARRLACQLTPYRLSLLASLLRLAISPRSPSPRCVLLACKLQVQRSRLTRPLRAAQPTAA
jgi:hypothetical protein